MENSGEFKKCIDKADLVKLSRLLKIVGMLLQTKVYLFAEKASECMQRGARHKV
jgi:hypothetical protein